MLDHGPKQLPRVLPLMPALAFRCRKPGIVAKFLQRMGGQKMVENPCSRQPPLPGQLSSLVSDSHMQGEADKVLPAA